MTDKHTGLPWLAAAKYSSVVGVPIVGPMGERIANTSSPQLPAGYDDIKERDLANAALIVRAVNSHKAFVAAATAIKEHFDARWNGDEAAPTITWDEVRKLIPPLNAALSLAHTGEK